MKYLTNMALTGVLVVTGLCLITAKSIAIHKVYQTYQKGAVS
jgi:hypothetical protein